MTKEDIIRKVTSRKLWMAIALFVSGVITATTGDASKAEIVAGLIMQGAAVLGYIFGEGLVDASKKPPDEPPDAGASVSGQGGNINEAA